MVDLLPYSLPGHDFRIPRRHPLPLIRAHHRQHLHQLAQLVRYHRKLVAGLAAAAIAGQRPEQPGSAGLAEAAFAVVATEPWPSTAAAFTAIAFAAASRIVVVA